MYAAGFAEYITLKKVDHMRMTCSALSILLMFAAFPAHGKGELDRSAEYSKCIEKSGGVDPAILDCISAEYVRADKQLNNAYKKLMSLLQPERKKQLQDAQRLWGKYTEANCIFYYDPEGGTSAHLMANECDVTARVIRAKELEELKKFQADTQ